MCSVVCLCELLHCVLCVRWCVVCFMVVCVVASFERALRFCSVRVSVVLLCVVVSRVRLAFF